MDELSIPMVVAQTPIGQGLRLLQEYDVRALLVDHGESRVRLHMNRALIEAAADGLELCQQISGGRIVEVFEKQPVDMEKELNKRVRDFGIVLPFDRGGGRPQQAVLTTIAETLAATIRSAAKVCVCDKDRTHIFGSPPGSQGGGCLALDGGSLNCY